MKLFLDDERDPPNDGSEWKVVRSVQAAKEVIIAKGLPNFISFDHDLGEDLTGYDLAKWLCEYAMDHNLKLGFDYYVHSQNPIGVKNIGNFLEAFKKFQKEG